MSARLILPFGLLLVACVPGGRQGTFTFGGPADSGEQRPDDAEADAASGGQDAEPGADRPAGQVDAPSYPDARPDAGVPDAAGCTDPANLPPGSMGPINLAAEPNHGLPGCYRCGVEVADFDSDGRVDVVMSGPFDSAWVPGMGNYTYQNRVRLFRNVSCPGADIRFEQVMELNNARGGGGSLVEVGDFDGNGLADFAVQFREGDPPDSNTAAFLNQGGWRFTKSPLGNFDTNSTSLGIAKGDIDRDGRDDLILISDAYGAAPGLWYRYNGSAWEARQTDFPHAMSYGGTIELGDLNGDGFVDLVVGGNASEPFGSYDCSNTLLYGQIHLNTGGASPQISQSAVSSLGKFALRSNRSNPPVCTGMDNASVLVADMDNDGTQDIVIAGSADSFNGPPGMNGSHYDFAVLFNKDGSGNNFLTFEHPGAQLANGTTNGGTGNLDSPSAAVGDLNGDGLPEAFLQGHHRDYTVNSGSAYVFDTRLFLNVGGTSFTEVDLGLPDVGEGGQAIADFNIDGKPDLLFAGATLPFHSNGSNPTDNNNAGTLQAHVYRNTRP